MKLVDIIIIAVYAVSIFGLAQWVSREKGTHKKDAQDYFLAGRTLPWWAIGTSLIAANISAEQIIGMSGSGYVIGLGIASYEWMAALTLIIVGKYFLPIFLKNGIYTMPEFLERRYSPAVRTVMAIFWLGVYVFVNLTAILWLGATAVHTVTGIDVQIALLALGLFAGLGHWLIVSALQHTQPSLLTPFSYLQMIWATLYGFLIFDQLPDRWSAVGMTVIVASGLLLALQERRRTRY